MKYNAGASYLKENEWNSISVYLDPFVDDLISISNEQSLKFECGKRWPSLEMSRERRGILESFKLSLNSNYLEDNRVFFEFFYNKFSKKIFGNASVEKTEILGSYSLQEMNDFNSVLNDIKSKLGEIMLGVSK
ncbi:hypothetical protein [Microbulbifer sp. 2205BS26-8]|uniref:hypothetical protein n=1 Tax=Microbulbifer sp. 2205BS26-8 TaxID=3064386 RepID=UPI00273DBAB3|nr:hypothetical protein [Microbulbifer sp. 2205BS26-8]MDP5211318.1 hypothetical protein [Microbulbifer sp. 2205BS26-8]